MREGRGNPRSSCTRAMASCRRSSYVNGKFLQVTEKFPSRQLQDSSRWTGRIVATGSSRNIVLWISTNKGVRVSKEDMMDQSQSTKYRRFVCSMPFTTLAFSYARCARTSNYIRLGWKGKWTITNSQMDIKRRSLINAG